MKQVKTKYKPKLIALIVLMMAIFCGTFTGCDVVIQDDLSGSLGIVAGNDLKEHDLASDAGDKADIEEKAESQAISEVKSQETVDKENEKTYTFRNKGLLKDHFEKHGAEFPYETKEDYVTGANIMLANPNKLHKIEKEDGDDVYYLEETNEFIIVSKDGYIRTYFKPSRGIKYFNSQ